MSGARLHSSTSGTTALAELDPTVVRSQDSVRAPRNGDLIGSYLIEQLLAQGGMGRVYRATDPDGRAVALKVIKPEYTGDPTFRRRFARETRAALAVRHAHLVPVLEAGEHDGMPYLATAFLAGGSLAGTLAEERALGLERAVRVLLDVAAGLDALHAAGLVHRDVKPANILLDLQGRAYVTDFGLAKSRDASALTRTGFAVGSLPYMAPEQTRAEEVTVAADVYALGCVAFECLAGRAPFAGLRAMQMIAAHRDGEPSDPCHGRADGSAELTWAVLRALAKDPAARPPTATSYARMVQVAAGVPPLSPGR
jgi:serine/threonine kinase PknH